MVMIRTQIRTSTFDRVCRPGGSCDVTPTGAEQVSDAALPLREDGGDGSRAQTPPLPPYDPGDSRARESEQPCKLARRVAVQALEGHMCLYVYSPV